MYIAGIGITHKRSAELLKKYQMTIKNNTHSRYLIKIMVVVETGKPFCQ